MECMKKAIQEQEETGDHEIYDLRCKFGKHLCYYVVDCHPVGQNAYECKKVRHMVDFIGFCCDVVCHMN